MADEAFAGQGVAGKSALGEEIIRVYRSSDAAPRAGDCKTGEGRLRAVYGVDQSGDRVAKHQVSPSKSAFELPGNFDKGHLW